MGPRSDNRGYGWRAEAGEGSGSLASMGPRSDNRGYGAPAITKENTDETSLQWVHGPITVVMEIETSSESEDCAASMGPRSDNRGYGGRMPNSGRTNEELLLVHGPKTRVMAPTYRD